MSCSSSVSNIWVCPVVTSAILTLYPLITPFLSSSAGGLHVSMRVHASGIVAVKACGGPLGTDHEDQEKNKQLKLCTVGYHIATSYHLQM